MKVKKKVKMKRKMWRAPKNRHARELYKRLIDLDLTVTELAKEMGITPMAISKILSLRMRAVDKEKMLEKRLGLEDGWFEKVWKEKKDEKAKSGN